MQDNPKEIWEKNSDDRDQSTVKKTAGFSKLRKIGYDDIGQDGSSVESAASGMFWNKSIQWPEQQTIDDKRMQDANSGSRLAG